MSVIGIIAEFNPLHTGHYYLLQQAKSRGTVVCALSGNFVQRGDTAFLEKRRRTLAALKCGADLVIELPVCWSMSTAQNFALGGVSLLDSIGCDTLMFGSECGDIAALQKAADVLMRPEYSTALSKVLKKGITFASARSAAAADCGADNEVLLSPNNNLAVEYIIAARKLNSDIRFETVKRLGAGHDSDNAQSSHVSATLLRSRLLSGDFDFARRYMPPESLNTFTSEDFSDISRIETAILAVLRSKNREDLSILPDLSEGIQNRLYSAVRHATGLDGLYNSIKVKRYTLARIRRLVLSAFVGIDDTFFLKTPPYMRVLGFNRRGETLLRKNAPLSPIPVVCRAGEIPALGKSAEKVFETENRATDLFSLSLSEPLPCGLEYKEKIIKLEC